MKTFTMKVPESLDMKIASAARTRGVSKSAVAREALETFLERGEVSGHVSCFDLAKDLVGCVDGPQDLASNKKHMRGYGK